MKVVVTGGDGFVGQHVCSALRAAGHYPEVIDRKSGRDINHGTDHGVAFVGAEAVIHCAAHADIRNNWTDESLVNIWRDNVVATDMTLEWATEHPTIKAFVFVSTAAVYAGKPGPHSESHPCEATSPYAASKLAGEAYVQAYAHKCGWRWHCIRPAACFGHGYAHGHVADFVKQARRGGRIAGLNRPSRKSALHVRDLADSLIKCATEKVPSGIYNLAAVDEWTWADTAKMMGVEFGYPDVELGWVGDGRADAHMTCYPAMGVGLSYGRLVADGVRQSLESLGWK